MAGVGAALLVCVLCLAGVDRKTLQNYIQACIDGRQQGGNPGLDRGMSFDQCPPWKERSCSTNQVSEDISPTWHNFDWNHCPTTLSQPCWKYLMQDLCFHECSPNVGPCLLPPNIGTGNRRSVWAPPLLTLCKTECDAWPSASENDAVCENSLVEGQDCSTGNAAAKNDDKEPAKRRVVIIGTGPTALGAARRLYDLKQEESNNTVITILEQMDKAGGISTSMRDDKGFLWDVGIHVVFSHYTYFDRVLNLALSEWNYRRRAAFAFMKGSDGIRRFIPYPLQSNIHVMDKVDQQRSLAGLEEITDNPIPGKPGNFDEWLLQKFGKGLADVFMRKYNQKIWTVDTKEMNAVWVGERVAVPDISDIRTKIKEMDDGMVPEDSGWGPNRYFRFPRYNGTGGLWETVAKQLPRHWFRFNERVTGIDIDKKVISVEAGQEVKSRYDLEYDTIISTVPLDVFTAFLKTSDCSVEKIRDLASQLVHTHSHIIGVGLTGQIPESLADKLWVYFSDSDAPFYRVSMFSSFSHDHVPQPEEHWSLMCEIAEPENSSNSSYWIEENLVKVTISALVDYGFITADMVVSEHYYRLEHGYPVPSMKRDQILDTVQPWLKSKGIYSRGRFGGWRYEAGNQDHSFMQGVEAVDDLVRGIDELTYPDANRANSKKNTDRVLPLDYEIVVSQLQEDVDWLKPYASNTVMYHRGNDLSPAFQCYGWERLQNVGQESYAYLHHITTYYNQLANVTVFAHGGSKDDTCFQDLLEFVSSVKTGVPCPQITERYKNTDHSQFPKEYLRSGEDSLKVSNSTFDEIYKHLFGKPFPQEGIEVCSGSCFGATKEMIRKRPVEFYEKALKYLSEYNDQEESRYVRILWNHFFT